jgi:hypothetical protein
MTAMRITARSAKMPLSCHSRERGNPGLGLIQTFLKTIVVTAQERTATTIDNLR